jgi:arylsulfatase A-like enzyme
LRWFGAIHNHGAVPKDNPVHVSDFVATIYHALGYDRNTKVIDFEGRPHYIVQGHPVLPLFR